MNQTSFTEISSQRICSLIHPATSSSLTSALPSSWLGRKELGLSVARLNTCRLRSSQTSRTTSAPTSGLLASSSLSFSPALRPSRTGRLCLARCTRTFSKGSAPSPSPLSSRATPQRLSGVAAGSLLASAPLCSPSNASFGFRPLTGSFLQSDVSLLPPSRGYHTLSLLRTLTAICRWR